MLDSPKIYHQIQAKLNALRRKIKRVSLLEGLVLSLSAVISLLLLLIALEALLHLSSLFRTSLVLVSILCCLGMLTRYLFKPLLSLVLNWPTPSDEHLAQQIGASFPFLKDRLVNTLQVYHKRSHNSEGYSLDLIDASLKEIWGLVKDLDFERIVDLERVKRAGRFLITPSLALLFFAGLFPSTFRSSANRVLHPTREFITPPSFTLEIEPGDIEVLEGQTVVIKVKAKGNVPQQVLLNLREEDREIFEQKALRSVGPGCFQYKIENLRESIEYFATAGEVRTPNYWLTLIKRPMVRTLQLQLTYPPYSGLGSRYLEKNIGDVTALIGTQVNLKIKANKIIKEAKLIFRSGEIRNLKPRGKEVRGGFTLRKDDKYHIQLVDLKGNANLNPIQYHIKTLLDQYPTVKISQPGKDVDLGEDMLLPLRIQAEDDFGFSKIRLGYRIDKGPWNQLLQDTSYRFIPLDFNPGEGARIKLNYTWDLSSFNLMPGDMISYFAEVFDNDLVSGPKKATSRTYTARFPSVYEIYKEVASGQEEEIESLESMVEESRRLKQRLDQLAQEMKRDAKLNWSKRQNLEETLERQQKLQQRLQKIKWRLDEMIERMEKNELLCLETLRKYHELQELFQQITTPELQKALEELRKALEQINPERLRKAVQRFRLSQEDFLKSIERTLSILKRLLVEQKMDQVVRLTEELLKRQGELNEELKMASRTQLKDIAPREDKLGEDLEALRESLQDLKEKMKQFPKMPIFQVETALNMINNIKQNIERASGMMRKGDKGAAVTAGAKVSDALSELSQTLRDAQRQMKESQKREIMEALQRTSRELLRLSQEQEGLRDRSKELQRGSPQFGILAEDQLNLLEGLNRITEKLYQLSQKTFFVTPEIGKAIGKSLANMREALKDLEQRNGFSALKHQSAALGGLNEAVWQIRSSMKSLSAASSGIGFEEYLKRLQAIAGQQQGINLQTMELSQNKGMLTMEQQAALAHLAAEQEALRKSLEQLYREMGQRSEILGRLEEVIKQMEQVVEDLKRQRVDEKTIERQKRILSRLLDAQRSIRERDYSKKRRAERPREYTVSKPGELPKELIYQKDRLREDILEAKKEGYTQDYLELIRQYFEALAEER